MIRKFLVTFMIAALLATPILASSHSEAPLIARDRFADNTDTYAFRSIEPGREGYVTLIRITFRFNNLRADRIFFVLTTRCITKSKLTTPAMVLKT